MRPSVDPVQSDVEVPARSDVVVVGGGIAGVSTALFLAQRGVSVTLCEKGRIGGEQSSRNWGWVRTMGRDPREIPLSIESLRLWRNMNATVGAETGYREAGIVYLCDTHRDVEKHEAWLEHARPYQVDSRLLGPEEVDRLLPGSARPWAGALYTPSDGRAEPAKAAPAIAEGARRFGATILTGCAVRGLETQAGRVSAAVTEKGRIACGSVVLAGGAWSRLFCGNLGVKFPALKVLGSVMRTQPLEGGPECAVGASDFGFRKRLDGGYTVARRGATEADIVPGQLSPVLRLPPGFARAVEGVAPACGPPLPDRMAGASQMVARRSLALREGARPRSRTRRIPARGGARELVACLPLLQQHGRGRALGWPHRRHPGRRPGDLRGRRPARLLHRSPACPGTASVSAREPDASWPTSSPARRRSSTRPRSATAAFSTARGPGRTNGGPSECRRIYSDLHLVERC